MVEIKMEKLYFADYRRLASYRFNSLYLRASEGL